MLVLLHSLWNRLWFAVRRALRFRRSGYREASPLDLPFVVEAQGFNERYEFARFGTRLFPRHWIRNLASLWYLEQMLRPEELPAALEVLEPCCQDFVRLSAWRAYFAQQGKTARFTGIEIDAYVPLTGFHSRWDHARYYLNLQDDGSEYVAADFFKYSQPSDLILCFYPFVVPSPALAWGLPAEVASAERWVKSFADNLKPGGLVLVAHQGDWEEREFDRARDANSADARLELVRRAVLQCPFFQTKHPMHASLYRKI